MTHLKWSNRFSLLLVQLSQKNAFPKKLISNLLRKHYIEKLTNKILMNKQHMNLLSYNMFQIKRWTLLHLKTSSKCQISKLTKLRIVGLESHSPQISKSQFIWLKCKLKILKKVLEGSNSQYLKINRIFKSLHLNSNQFQNKNLSSAIQKRLHARFILNLILKRSKNSLRLSRKKFLIV